MSRTRGEQPPGDADYVAPDVSADTAWSRSPHRAAPACRGAADAPSRRRRRPASARLLRGRRRRDRRLRPADPWFRAAGPRAGLGDRRAAGGLPRGGVRRPAGPGDARGPARSSRTCRPAAPVWAGCAGPGRTRLPAGRPGPDRAAAVLRLTPHGAGVGSTPAGPPGQGPPPGRAPRGAGSSTAVLAAPRPRRVEVVDLDRRDRGGGRVAAGRGRQPRGVLPDGVGPVFVRARKLASAEAAPIPVDWTVRVRSARA